MEAAVPRRFSIPPAWQIAWFFGLLAALGSTAFFGTWVGVAVQGSQWRLLAASLPLFGLCAAFLYWLATRVRQIVVGEKSVVLEAAALEREVDFDEIERVGVRARGKNFRVFILCKQGGGYRMFSSTREWADLLGDRAGIPVENLVEPSGDAPATS